MSGLALAAALALTAITAGTIGFLAGAMVSINRGEDDDAQH